MDGISAPPGFLPAASHLDLVSHCGPQDWSQLDCLPDFLFTNLDLSDNSWPQFSTRQCTLQVSPSLQWNWAPEREELCQKEWVGYTQEATLGNSKLRETVRDGEAWRTAAGGVAQSWIQLSDWTVTCRENRLSFLFGIVLICVVSFCICQIITVFI